MSISRSLLSIALALCTVAGCKAQQEEPITVAVFPTTQRCTVDEQPVDCAQVGAYLRDTLKVKTERQIIVSAVGSDPLPKEDHSLDMIAAKIRDAGLKDVRTVNFDLK